MTPAETAARDEALALLDTLTDDERAVLLGWLAVAHRDELAAAVEQVRGMNAARLAEVES